MQHIYKFYGLMRGIDTTNEQPSFMTKIKRQKILFVITKSNWGGAQRYVYDLASRLQPTHEVVVAYGGHGPLADKLNEAGVRTISIKSLQRDVSLSKELKSIKELYSLIRLERPDILHINSSKAGLYGTLIGRLLSVPRIIFTAHGWAFNEPRSWLSRTCFRLLHWLTVWLSHRTIAVSGVLKKQLNIPFMNSKIVTVPLAIASPDYLTKNEARQALSPKLAANDTSIWLGTIAELHPVKNHRIILNALPDILKTYPNCYYIAVGSGEEENSLRQLARELNISEHIIFTGHVPDAARYIKAFDLFLLPSITEAAGYVLHEAAHAGVPIIASNVGGIPELITNKETGLLISPTDVSAWQQVLKEVLSNSHPTLDYATLLQKQVTNRSLEDMIFTTEEVYRSIK